MLTVEDFSGRDLGEAMRQGRFRLDIGRLRVKVKSGIPHFPVVFKTLYGRHSCAVDGGEYDFDISIVPPNWLRRHIARNVVFELSGERPFLPVDAGHAHALFEWGLNWTIGSFAHTYLILHSAVLETRGAGVLLSAVSGSGKSTLAAELALSGWRLLSDELALLDERLKLIPCVRPVSLKNSSIDLIQSRHPEAVFGPLATNTHKGSIAHLPAPSDSIRRGSESATPRLIVFPKWVDGAALRMRAVGQGQAAMRLIDQSFNYSTLGASGFQRLVGLVSSAEAWEIEYSSLDKAREALNELVEHHG